MWTGVPVPLLPLVWTFWTPERRNIQSHLTLLCIQIQPQAPSTLEFYDPNGPDTMFSRAMRARASTWLPELQRVDVSPLRTLSLHDVLLLV